MPGRSVGVSLFLVCTAVRLSLGSLVTGPPVLGPSPVMCCSPMKPCSRGSRLEQLIHRHGSTTREESCEGLRLRGGTDEMAPAHSQVAVDDSEAVRANRTSNNDETVGRPRTSKTWNDWGIGLAQGQARQNKALQVRRYRPGVDPDVLDNFVGESVCIHMKGGMQFTGTFHSYDAHGNICLDNSHQRVMENLGDPETVNWNGETRFLGRMHVNGRNIEMIGSPEDVSGLFEEPSESVVG